jgi:hypothetical protein
MEGVLSVAELACLHLLRLYLFIANTIDPSARKGHPRREKSMKKPRQMQRGREDDLRFFPLEGLLPAGQALSVNITYLIVSLVSTNSMNGSPILRQQLVLETDMRLLLLLLESPRYCPQEALRASLFCSYPGLLAGLFSPATDARAEWQTAMEEQHLYLQCAQELGNWKKALKPLYNALSKLRCKLHPLGLEIVLIESCAAYALMPLHLPQQHPGSNWNSALQVLSG